MKVIGSQREVKQGKALIQDKNTSKVLVYIDEITKAELELLAKQGYSVSAWIRNLIVAELGRLSQEKAWKANRDMQDKKVG